MCNSFSLFHFIKTFSNITYFLYVIKRKSTETWKHQIFIPNQKYLDQGCWRTGDQGELEIQLHI